MTCTATLTTAVVEDGELIVFHLACNRPNHNVDWQGFDMGGMHWHAWRVHEPWRADWHDDTPGATPHTPPLVTDKEWSAALASDIPTSRDLAKAALDAAAADPEPAASETNRQTDTSRLSDFDSGDTPRHKDIP